MAGPSFASVRAPMWAALAQQLGPRPWAGDRVEVHQANWRLLLDSYRVPIERFDHTRMILALPRLPLRFRIYEPNALSWFGTVFGLLDIAVGDEHFDARWVVKASSSSKVRALLADAGLRGQITALQHAALSLEPDQSRIDPQRIDDGKEWDELVLVQAELQTTLDALRPMFDVLATAVERLEALAPTWSK